MKKSIIILTALTLLILPGCCKDQEDRTTHIPAFYKQIFEINQEGDTFYMEENGRDTLMVVVGQHDIWQNTTGSFCSKKWTEEAWVRYDLYKKNLIQFLQYILDGT